MMGNSNDSRQDMIVFNFHGLGTPHKEVPDDERPYWCDRDLYLSLLDTIKGLEQEAGIPIRITFDDGNRSDLDIATPALSERGMTAEFFICSGRIGQEAYLSADDLAEMERCGMKIGSHGIDHLDLRRLDAVSLAEEAEGSRGAIDACLAQPIDSFAIPFGSYDRRVLKSLRGYHRVYNSDQLHARNGGQWLIPRISYVAGWEPETPRRHALTRPSVFNRTVSGLKVMAKSLR
eukprot:s1_g39.t1